MFKNFYCGLTCLAELFQSLFLLIIRLYWGYGFFESGYGKLTNIANTVSFFQELKIPLATLNAYIAGGIECFGGLLLIAGLFSRVAAIPLIIVMIVAYATVDTDALLHIWSNPDEFVKVQPFNFLMAALIVFAFGPGKISLDYLICKLFFQKKCGDDTSCTKK